MTTKAEYAKRAAKLEATLEPCPHCGRVEGAPSVQKWNREYAASLRKLAESADPICERCGGNGVERGTHGRGDCSLCKGAGTVSAARPCIGRGRARVRDIVKRDEEKSVP